MINALFAAGPDRWDTYVSPLKAAFEGAGLEVDLRQDFAPKEVDYIIYAPNSDLQDFRPYTRCKAVLNLWAGVEKITGNATLTQPLCRMVDPGLTQSMVEWVTGHVLRYHLEIDRSVALQDRWLPYVPPLAEERPVTILGLGELGQACATALTRLGFPVSGWSRTAKDLPSLSCHHGTDGLRDALASAQIVVLLLPDTPQTANILDSNSLGWLPQGARIINPGRGPLIDDAALLTALDTGPVDHATLDVFRVEPLPEDHPYWAHPRVTVTPHIAAETRPLTASRVIAENMRRGEAGEAFLYVVDRDRGY
ncbi:2-hydroxyacid dehydrogenase [Tritonibacter scottomollicae]|uniref:Glyoxylate/hydroxypyruvate reductase A n=1 Tax=Tritonibacter scottomollicae TaxID=483013 RepID=A0A2T1AG41_TRISK|nr:glyoxylate/hydroxypyruvate reductase A [Tritonibacter scottomollicae]PRZ47517.1 glyoxylate/hydroxypyruvate reductase A [Tritonibacter scottomollicae]